LEPKTESIFFTHTRPFESKMAQADLARPKSVAQRVAARRDV
jgi:hypothetical protein